MNLQSQLQLPKLEPELKDTGRICYNLLPLPRDYLHMGNYGVKIVNRDEWLLTDR